MKRTAQTALVAIAVTAAIATFSAAEQLCVQSSQHYEGSPKPDVYVVTVLNNCEQKRIVTVNIVDALSMETLKQEVFPLSSGETRFVKYRFEGEKLLSYSISHTEE